MCTGFARMVLLGVSMNSGFVGGVVFPLLTIGMIAGAVLSQMYPSLPVSLCESIFMVSIACGFVPLPITFTLLSAFIFFLGAYQSIPIFVAVLTSYMIVCGTGLIGTLKRFAKGCTKHRRAQQHSILNESEISNPSSVEMV